MPGMMRNSHSGIPEGQVGGGHTYIDRGEYLLPVAELCERDPSDLCLKICYTFPPDPEQSLEDYGWCGSPLPVLDCAKLQNICYWKDLAPRVYWVGKIDWENLVTVAWLMDYVGDGEPNNTPLFKKACAVMEEYGGFHQFSHGDGGQWNSAGGKWLGFKAAGFKDKEAYKKKIGVDEPAKADPRTNDFVGVNLKDKTVLVTKCGHGEVCNLADIVGAKRVVGVTNQLDLCRQLSNYFGHFNIDYVSDPKESDIEHFDFVF